MLTLVCCHFSPVDVSVALPVTLKMRITTYLFISAQDVVKYALSKIYFFNFSMVPTEYKIFSLWYCIQEYNTHGIRFLWRTAIFFIFL